MLFLHLIRTGAVKNLQLDEHQIKSLSTVNSKSWILGHMKASALSLSNTDKSTLKPMNTMATDLMAKFPVTSRKGNNWCLLFACVVTGYLIPIFTKTKDQSSVQIALKHVKSIADKYGHSWKVLQSDSESDFNSADVNNFCIKHLIDQQYSAPYKHGQNGSIERRIGILQDLVRTMMLQYAVPPSLLEDCITYSCYIMNNFHIQKNRSVSATEEVTTNIPDFSRVVPFYSKGFAHISQEERKGKGKMTVRV
jgi:hypothetical protein